MNPSKMVVRPVAIDWSPRLSVFASKPFLESVSDECGWLGGFDDRGELRCVLPYTVIRRWILRMVRFRVETIPWSATLTIEEEKNFLNGAATHFRTAGAHVIIPASNNTLFRTYPDGAIAAPYGSFVVDLTQPEEVLWANVHSKHRNSIRSATKKGVTIEFGMQRLNEAYQMIKDTLGRSGLSFIGRRNLDRMLGALGEHVSLCVALCEGAVQGCALIPHSLHSAYYLYGGSAHEPVSGAMNLLQWEAMRHFKNLGVARYDFVGVRVSPKEGSKQAGLYMFKERFGGELRRGYMWKRALCPLRSKLYSLAARLRSGGDIVDLEHAKLANTASDALPAGSARSDRRQA